MWLALPFAFVQAVTADSTQSQTSCIGQPSIVVYQSSSGRRISRDAQSLHKSCQGTNYIYGWISHTCRLCVKEKKRFSSDYQTKQQQQIIKIISDINFSHHSRCEVIGMYVKQPEVTLKAFHPFLMVEVPH